MNVFTSIDDFIPPFHSNESTYIDSLCTRLDSYSDFIKNNVTSDSYILNKIKYVNRLILQAISATKLANAQESYSLIGNFIRDEMPDIGNPTYSLNDDTPLIRFRHSEFDLMYRRDLFHIPFNLRHNVSQQRFSINGVPCLYLSGCAFTAWLELNKPNFSNLWCAGFRANNEIKVLDLAIRLDSIIEERDNSGKLIFYPFVIATSYITKYPNSPFKEEYIISNILLQAVINSTDLKGIRYFSTKISNYNREYAWMASNIVLPAYHECGNYDELLKSSLLVTFPQPCLALMHSPNIGDVSCLGTHMAERDVREDLSTGINHFESRIFEWYPATQFFNIDGYLRRQLAYHSIE